MEEITEEAAELVARVAALDIGKASLVACVRVPHETSAGRRRQEVRTFATTTRSLLELQDWLVCQGVSLCVMEATSTYWKPPFYLLEDVTQCWVVNARDVKNVPGRPKTDRLDAVWLAKLAERGMLRASFVPPPWQRQLRDLCRYRRTLIQERTREKQRVEKLLEDTQIKLSVVISDIFGKSGRDMLEALIAGQRDPHVLARMARGTMRKKISVLQEALTGHFRDHHGYLLRMMLDRVDGLTAQIEALTGRIEEVIAPFARQVAQLDEITGVGPTGAQELIAESGSPGALPHRGPLRTVRAPRRRTRLKQAPRAWLRAGVLASCVGGPEARGGRRCVSSGFGCRPACRARPGGRGSRRRLPCGPCSATTVPTPLGTGAGQR